MTDWNGWDTVMIAFGILAGLTGLAILISALSG